MNAFPETFEHAFTDCLEQIQQGKSLDEVLQNHPIELRPLLEMALNVRQYAQEIPIPASAQERSKAKLLQNVEQTLRRRTLAAPAAGLAAPVGLAAVPAARQRSWLERIRGISLAPRLGLVFTLLLVALLTTTVSASAKALPGDKLYPIKLAGERARLLFAFSSNERLRLQEGFDDERAEEIQALIHQSRTARIEFAGSVSAIQPTEWTVDGIQIEVTPNTLVDSIIEVGFYVDVQGVLEASGSVHATRIQAREMNIQGKIEAVSDSRWVIDGVALTVRPTTRIEGQPALGLKASAQAYLMGDGSLLVDWIQVNASGGSLAQPSQTPTQTPDAGTETAEPSPTDDDDIETPEVSETPEPEETESPESPEIDDDSEGSASETETPEPTEDESNDGESDDGSADRTPEPTEEHDSGSDGEFH